MNWQPRPLADLGDLIGRAVLLVTEDGAYQGGLRAITESDIHVEVGEGHVIAIERRHLTNEMTQLFALEVPE
jgi:hypothetical protein